MLRYKLFNLIIPTRISYTLFYEDISCYYIALYITYKQTVVIGT